MTPLHANVIRLASANPGLRSHLLPLLKQAMDFDTPEAMQAYLKEHPGADKSNHHVKKKEEESKKDDSGVSSKKDPKALVNDVYKGHEVLESAITRITNKKYDKNEGYKAKPILDFVSDMKTRVKPKDVQKLFQNSEAAYHAALDAASVYGRGLIKEGVKPGDVWDDPGHKAVMKELTRAENLSRAMSVLLDHSKDDPDSFGKKPAAPKKKLNPAVKQVVTKHSLTDEDVEQVEDFKKSKPMRGKPISDAEKMKRFLQHAKPETKERMKGVSVADFMKMLGAILDEEEVGKTAATNEDTVYLGDGAYVTNEDGQVIIYTSNGIRRENEVWIEDVPLLIRALQKLSR